jgi:ribosome-binding protein aMBF1 (putative translation factor)
MADGLVCWRCGADLKDVPLPLGRRSECPACQAELHVCRLCRHYDTAKAKHCREPMAEEVKDKTRANFCEWLQPRADAYTAAARRPGREGLEALFDSAPDAAALPVDARRALDDLFG